MASLCIGWAVSAASEQNTDEVRGASTDGKAGGGSFSPAACAAVADLL